MSQTQTDLGEDLEGELVAESALVKAEGPLGSCDTTYSVPHQQDHGKAVVFDLLTVTIDDIISQCGYPESARDNLAETHQRIARHLLAYYKGPIKNPVPLLEEAAQVGVSRTPPDRPDKLPIEEVEFATSDPDEGNSLLVS